MSEHLVRETVAAGTGRKRTLPQWETSTGDGVRSGKLILKWTPIFGPVVKVDLGSGVGTLDEVVSWRHQEVQDGADTTSI